MPRVTVKGLVVRGQRIKVWYEDGVVVAIKPAGQDVEYDGDNIPSDLKNSLTRTFGESRMSPHYYDGFESVLEEYGIFTEATEDESVPV